MTGTSIQEIRAARGAKRVDERYPGWYREIDTERLDMNDVFNCVIGQLKGNYRDNVGLFVDAGEDVIYLGFDPGPYWAYWATGDGLTEAWRKEIRARLALDAEQAGR